MLKKIISAGDKITCKNKSAVLGAVIKYHRKNCVLTVYHLLKLGGCGPGDPVEVAGWEGRVNNILFDLDMAIVEVQAPDDVFEFSQIKKPKIGPAFAINGSKKNPCHVLSVGHTYHYLSFPFSNIPLPGDSGSPIIQGNAVVGILASVFFNNAAGIAVSLEKFTPHNE